MKSKNKTQVVEKKRIRPVLKNMKLYETEEYPANRFEEIRSTAYTLSRKDGKKFTTKTDNERDIICITRIA